MALVIMSAGLVAGGCPRPNGYQLVRVFPNIALGEMLGFHPIPDDPGYAIVLTRQGVAYRASLTNSSAQPQVWLDLRGKLVDPLGSEEGLLGLAFAPDFPQSRRFYVHYSAPGAPGTRQRRSVISRFTAGATAADAASEREILSVPDPASNHNGGALAFGPDGMLYLGLGDGGGAGDQFNNGQDKQTLLGDILRIDVSGDGYTIPADNPYVGGGGAPEIWASGFRNPWRISFDRVTGQLWTADVGEREWEEVDRVVRGANYGWSVLEGDACFRARTCNRDGFLAPRATYSHEFGCSVTGGYVYRGPEMKELQGWYVYGDYCSGRMWAVDAATNEGAAIPLADTGVQISAFAEGLDGTLYVVTFDNAIFKLVGK